MTVKTAALPRQQLEAPAVAVPRRPRRRKGLVVFATVVGIVELAWLALLFELLLRFA